MNLALSPEEIINYFDIGMIVLFAAVIAVFVLGFLRGLRQGWKYGTFRFVFFALLITGALFTLKYLGNWIADFNLATFNFEPIEFNVDVDESTTVLIHSNVTTIRETGTDIITQLLQAYNISADPEMVSEYAFAIVISFTSVIAILLEAIIIAIVGNLLCLLLWHLFFKWFIPKKYRKKKNLKLISGFEQAVTSFVILAMFLSPLTSMVNSISRSFERIPEETSKTTNNKVVDSDIYQTITGVLDTYDNSIFSKAFFSWYADDETGMRFDEAFLTYVSTVDLSNGNSISVVKEFANVIQAASCVVDGGLLSEDGVTAQSMATFATSQYAPKLLRSLGQSDLIQEVAPVALEIVFSIDEIADFLETEEGIDVSDYDCQATLNGLANIYDNVLDSGILDELVDQESGELIFDVEHVANIFAPEYQATFDSVFENLSDEKLAFLNDVICSAVYVQAVKEYQKADEAEEDEIVIGLKDLLPELTAEQLTCTPEGRPVAIPDSIKSINFAEEFQIIFDTLFELVNVDDEFLPLMLNPLLSEDSSFDDSTITGIMSIILNNIDNVEKFIDGKNLEEGKKSLLDSKLIANAVPAFLQILASTTNDMAGLPEEDAVNLDSVISDYKARDLAGKMEASKAETRSLFAVLRPFVTSEEGKALITDFEHLPGLYFDKTGKFMGAKEGLLTSLAQGLALIDNSKVFSKLLPAVLNNFISGDEGVFSSSLGIDLTLDFAPKDAEGNSILGHEISSIILAYAECQDAIGYLMDLSSIGSDTQALERTFSSLCQFKTESNELQVTKFLTAIGESKIFNPIRVENGTTIYNESIYKLFKMMFEATGFCDEQMDNDLKDIIMVQSFDFGAETSNLIELIQYLSDNHILGSFSGGLSLEKMASIPFGELFDKVGTSPLLQAVLGDIIDSNLASVAIFSYVDEAGVTVPLSFKDITDWHAEGVALDKLMNYASVVGDISSLAFDSIDPEMLSSLFGYLANSGMFVKTNEDGTHDWIFPKYLASKVVKIAKQSGDLGRFFTDIEEKYEAGEYKIEAKDQTLDDSYTKIKADILAYSITGTSDMTSIEDAKQTFLDEGNRLANIIRCLASSGAMSLMNDGINADLSNLKTPYLDDLLTSMSESIIMGRTGISQILLKLTDALKNASEPFGNANVIYAFETNTLSERQEVAQAIVTILEVVTDPVVGLLDGDGKIDTSKFTNLESLDANHFVAPILHALNSTEVFTTLSTFQSTTAGMTNSAFLGEMKVLLVNSTWYGSQERVDALLPIINADILANGGWDVEIDNFVKVFDDFNTMGFEMTSGFSLDGFFEEEKYGEDVVANLLIDINSSRMLYPGLPEKFDSAISSIQSGSLATSGISLTNANTYYAGKSTSGTYNYASRPYDDEECYKLASILGKSTLLSSIDLTDLSSLSAEDVDNVTALLADFAQSGIFNTLKEGKSSSVFQDVMGVVLGGDTLKEYYISSVSPKDAANTSHYTTATEKAKYIANVEYPYISSTNSNADTTNLTDASDPSSLRSLLNTLISDTSYTDVLSNGTFDTLDEAKMGLLLDALNKCDWTYDIVPNAIADSIKNQTLDAVELRRANPYYQYEFDITLNGSSYENSGTLLGSPNYENRYDDDEIDVVAKIVALVKNDSSLTSDFSSKAKVLELRRFLEALDDSYSFHLAGASYSLVADDNLSQFTLTDLPVFEQAMYNLYKQSGLASLAYNEVYDGEYATYEAKLLNKIKDYPDNEWSTELTNLIINDTMDKGLFCTAFDLALLNGSGSVSLSSSDILSKNPTELSTILYAANNVDITQELVAYELQKTIADTINFRTFSTVTAEYAVNASSFSLDLNNAVYKLEITMTSGSAPTVSYAKAGSTESATYTGSNPYVYTLFDGSAIKDRPLAKDLTISGSGTIESVKVTFTADTEIGLTQAEYDTETAGTHVGAINEIISIANDCFYDSGAGAYVNFATDPNALANIFGTPGNVTKIVSFLKSPHSFFNSTYTADFEKDGTAFDAGDISLAGMLSFKFSGHSINLFEYMPDYNETNRAPGYANIHDIFATGDVATVTSWLDSHMLEAGAFYGAYKALPNIQMIAAGVPSFAYNGESITTYLANTAGWNSFESAFKTGFSRKLYNDMRAAAISSAHFSGNLTSLYTPTSADYQGFLTLVKDSLIPLLGDLKVTGLTNETEAASLLNELANTASTSPYKDVIASFYEQALYEALLANRTASFMTQPSTNSTPFGNSGYLRNAAIILDPSLA